ncbi:MAG: PilZ domain-containing protein [Oligoflexus sp.]|nr:PilZ domain-containing protein [Oligoflexus sp.]
MNDAVKKDPAEEKIAQNKLEAYLQGPRKKRKNYVILALGDHFEYQIASGIENFVKKSYPALALSTAKTVDELTRQFGRNISLLVINDSFAPRDEVMKVVKALKEKRRDDNIPVIFLTKDAEALIKSYHGELLLYRESDEYLVYPSTSLPQILSRVKNGIDAKNRRKSRRYPVNMPVTYFHLTHDTKADGRLIDLSMHGALLTAGENTIFRLGDQVKISIPCSNFIHIADGDFIKISGRVRRVFISGNQVAISFEHVSEKQAQLIGQLLLAIVSRNFTAQTNRLKAQSPPVISSGRGR